MVLKYSKAKIDEPKKVNDRLKVAIADHTAKKANKSLGKLKLRIE